MILLSLREDQNIIQIDDNHIAMDKLLKDIIDKGLERRRCIAETKKHDRRLKETHVGAESRLPLIAFFDAPIVEAPSDVEFGEVLGVLDMIHDVRDKG